MAEQLTYYGARGSLKEKTKGTLVTCYAWSPKSGQAPHSVYRATCITQPYDYCPRCENSKFVVRLKVIPNLNEQEVACPRWEKDWEFSYILRENKKPINYVKIKRHVCSRRMFWFCSVCPNQNKENAPLAEDGWFDQWLKTYKKRK